MSSFRLAATLMVAAVSTALAQQPQMSMKKPTAQVTATVAETAAQAASKPARFSCNGPFTFNFTRVLGAGAPNVYDFSLEFTGAANASEMGPGKCMRARGWDFGPALSPTKKGVLIYRVDMGKCPFLESMTMEGGRITKYKTNERFMGMTWLEHAVLGGGGFTVDATYLGTQPSNAPVIYAVYVSPDIATREAVCTP